MADHGVTGYPRPIPATRKSLYGENTVVRGSCRSMLLQPDLPIPHQNPYSHCQLRPKNPQSSGRKFPSPCWVVVYSFGWRMVHRIQPVKRRRALLESNSPRNSRLQTHQDDETQGEADERFALGVKRIPHRIDRFAHALKTQMLRLPRPLGATARESSCCCSGCGMSPALRRSLRR